jgi:hypothetical protein
MVRDIASPTTAASVRIFLSLLSGLNFLPFSIPKGASIAMK